MAVPDPMSTVRGLEAFTGRGAGSDAERRAATWLADCCSDAGRDVVVETFWCRPNWALAALWHLGLAIAGSLVSLASPIVGIAILAIDLASVISDALTGRSLGRRLTPERASQNVVVSPRLDVGGSSATARLVLTANYDAGRIGLAYRIRPVSARMVRALHGATPGWLGWTAVAIGWLLVVAIIRQTGNTSHAVGAVQFPPTVALLLGFAVLVELATGNWSPAAGDNATGVATALAAASALTATPPRNLTVELVLTGAGDGEQIGLQRYLCARHRAQTNRLWRRWRRGNGPQTIVVAFAACAGGELRWWRSDGSFLPLRYSPSLRRIARQVEEDEPHLAIGAHRGRTNRGAFAARAAGLPAITIGCLDRRESAPLSHAKTDTSRSVDRQAIDRAVQFALLLADGIDAAVGETRARPAPTPA